MARIADSAAVAGAYAYSNTTSTATMGNAVTRVATLNGLASTAITSTIRRSSGTGQRRRSCS